MGDVAMSSLARTAAAKTITRLLDEGSLQIYSGPRPATADMAPVEGNTLLAELHWQTPAFGPVRDGLALATQMESVYAVGSGEPSWYRASRMDGAAVYDGAASDLGLTEPIVERALIVVSTYTYSHP